MLTPTRELAAQILEDLNGLAVHTPLTAAAVFGGVGMGPQEHAFRSGVDVIVGTPGRLLDHFRAPYARLTGLEFLVLDEADRMLDMGFLPDIRRVLRHLPKRRQTLFFSATMPGPIAELSREMLHDPVTINIERQSAPATGITQAVYPVPQQLKAPLLLAMLARGSAGRARVHADEAPRGPARAVSSASVTCPVQRIHGNRSQAQRTEALAGFKSGRYKVLVATDIAARGIDVTALGHVINFDVPGQPEDYIHRVGRTARAELTGSAFTLVVAGGRGQPARYRAGDRQAASAGDDARLRLRVASRRQPRNAACPAHRGDSGTQGRGSGTGPRRTPSAGRRPSGGQAAAASASGRGPGRPGTPVRAGAGQRPRKPWDRRK